jgi:tetratricopeptide (TPR) repeat protein
MLYLLVSIDYYIQIRTVDQELAAAIQTELSALEALYGYKRVAERDGALLYRFGQEFGLDPRRTLEFVFRVSEVLQSREKELFGFNLLIGRGIESNPENILKLLSKTLLPIEEDQQILIEADCLSSFADLVHAERIDGICKITKRDIGAVPGSRRGQESWKRTRLAREVVRKINTQHKARTQNRGIVIHGPVNKDLRLLLDAVQELLFRDLAIPRAPRLHTLFKRRSTFHPFINSIDPFFLKAAAQYLTTWEQQVWEDLKRLLWSMKPSVRNGQGVFYRWPKGVPTSLRRRGKTEQTEEGPVGESVGSVCPDHLHRDFYLAFHLYLTAYFRMLEENFLPAVLFCEDIDTYHPQSLEMLTELLKDFYQIQSFIPVFTSKTQKLPIDLGGRVLKIVAMRPLSRNEMARIAHGLYRGCKLPDDVLYSLRKYVRGKMIGFYHCLRFLERQGFLKKDKDTFHWQEGKPLEKVLPARSLSLTWQLIASLSFALKRLLFIVYLQAGLLDLWGLIDFLYDQGMAREDALNLLRDLEAQGLIFIENHAVALFPSFRKRLRRTVLEKEPDLESAFIDHLLERWRGGRYPHLVLLFFLLSKARRVPEGFEVLFQLLKQKLDELDFNGVRIFLDPKHFRFGGAEVKKNLDRLLIASRLRYLLLRGNLKEAEGTYLKCMEFGDDFEVHPAKGTLFLQMSRYLLVRGETSMALQWVKKGMIQFQNADHADGERESAIGLASVLLAEGKFDEALEYFAMADTAKGDREGLDNVVSHGLRAVALFVHGNLSRAAVETQTSLRISRSLKRREWELFLLFLAARVSFELGFYDRAQLGFQQALAVETLYEQPSARNVLQRWLARSFAYDGKLETAEGILGKVEDHWEKSYFLSECSFFMRNYGKALEHCDRAITLGQGSTQEIFPGERVRWIDGFRDVEGRCFELLRENALVRRILQSFQAYLWGLEGSSERGIEQLQMITRGGRIPPSDPYQSLYTYFYACTLPDVRKTELDDSLTVLSKSLKLLQQRASRIDDSTERWQYLSNNYWNSLLFAEAKKKKMI